MSDHENSDEREVFIYSKDAINVFADLERVGPRNSWSFFVACKGKSEDDLIRVQFTTDQVESFACGLLQGVAELRNDEFVRSIHVDMDHRYEKPSRIASGVSLILATLLGWTLSAVMFF